MKEKYLKELDFCINLREKKGACEFGGGNKCENCAVPYILLKFINGEVICGDVKRLNLDDWKKIFKNLIKNDLNIG